MGRPSLRDLVPPVPPYIYPNTHADRYGRNPPRTGFDSQHQPDGRGDLAPVGEARLTEHLAARLTALGLFVERQTVAPGRENILARLDGDPPPERGGGLLLFDAHQDTVPADNMTIGPWCATLREGRLYGRGACNVKGGMAAMIATLARLAAERPAGMPTILLSCPVNEEYQFSGVRALTAAWCDGKARRLPDAAIVAEPTGLDVVVRTRA